MEYIAGFISGVSVVVTGLMFWASWAMVEVKEENGTD